VSEELKQLLFSLAGAAVMWLITGRFPSNTPKELLPLLQILEEIRKSRQDKKAREELHDLLKDV
jgi:hypothetical protein